jgi:hypothetical protein
MTRTLSQLGPGMNAAIGDNSHIFGVLRLSM